MDEKTIYLGRGSEIGPYPREGEIILGREGLIQKPAAGEIFFLGLIKSPPQAKKFFWV